MSATQEAPAATPILQAPHVGRQAVLVGRLDLKRRLRDRSIVIQVFLAPILLGLIVGGAFAGGSGNLEATIWVADADSTETTRAISDAVAGSSEDGGVIFRAADVADQAQAQVVVDDGTADAVVLIPAGFTAAVRDGRDAELLVVGRAGSPIVTGVAQSLANGIAAAVRSQQISTGTAVGTAEKLDLPVDAAALARALQQPELIVVTDSRMENSFNLISFFAPGMAMLFLFFVMGTAARSILTERREGTLDRILSGPTSPTGVLLGKSLSVIALGLLSLLTVYLFTTFAFGVDWGDPIGVLLIIFASVIAIAGISLIITGLARTEEQAQSLTIIGTLMLAILGGTFVYTGSGPMATARAFTPNGQAAMGFIDLAAGEASWVAVLPRVAVILAIGLVTGTVGLLAIRRGFAR
jgi:ABC-2 type transport system permease protein